MIFHSEERSPQDYPENAKLIKVPAKDRGVSWDEVCKHLGQLQVTSLLVEGGSRVAASALQAGVVRKVALFYALKIFGSGGLSAIADLGIQSLDESIQLRAPSLRRVGDDFLLEAYIDSFRESS